MSLHRGGSFETHEDNLAVFADEKACHDRCHLDVVFFFSHDAHARSRSSFARSESYATCETTQLPDLELCDGQIVYMVMASSCLRLRGSQSRDVMGTNNLLIGRSKPDIASSERASPDRTDTSCCFSGNRSRKASRNCERWTRSVL